MATIHPSRMGLVPHAPPPASYSRDRTRGRSPSPKHSRHRSPSPSRTKDKSPERRGKDRDRDDGYRARDRSDDRRRRHSRSRSVDKAKENGRGRRASPEYGEYRRPSPLRTDEGRLDEPRAPWRQEENMYRGRRDGYGGGGGAGGGAEFMDSRREQRDKSTVSIWPPSPKAPTRSSQSPDPKRSKKSRKHRRDRSSSSDSSVDSEEERRRRDRKERKRARKEERKEKKRGKDKDRRRSRSVDRGSDDERDRRDRRKRSESRDRRSRSDDRHRRSNTRTKSPDVRPPSSEVEMEDEWVEAPTASPSVAVASAPATHKAGAMLPPPVPASALKASAVMDEDGSDNEIGPQPLPKTSTSKRIDERQYGGALLRGEGSAMAAFLQDGTDQRIPRRGEIGLSSDEIETFEEVGYVMSGSRHRRMNAVRMRKENQVISAEEKRGILKLQQEERERREAILREEFQALVDEKLKEQGK